MPKTTLRSNDKEGFIRAFTDEWLDLATDHKLMLDFYIEPANRKGVVKLIGYAMGAAGRDGRRYEVRYVCEYPTATVGTLEAALYRVLCQLGRLAREQVKEQQLEEQRSSG